MVRKAQGELIGLEGSLEGLEGVLAGSREARFSCLPVDDIPDVLDVGSLAVEILG